MPSDDDRAPPILHLPVELIFAIADSLCAPDRWKLMRTCKSFHIMLKPLLWHRGPSCELEGVRLKLCYGRIAREHSCLEDSCGKGYKTSHAEALLWAIEMKQPDVLNKAMRLHAVDEEFARCMIRPATVHNRGCAEVLGLLLRYVPNPFKDLEEWDIFRRQPLLVEAADKSSLDAFRTLLEHGANPRVEGSVLYLPLVFHLTTADAAAQAQMLLNHGAKLGRSVLLQTAVGYVTQLDRAYMIPHMVAAGNDVHRSTPQHPLPNVLCMAVEERAKGCIKALLSSGSGPLISGSTGENALSCAGRRDRRGSIVGLFLDHDYGHGPGVSIDARDGTGMTMLMHAVTGPDDYSTWTVHVLLERGADATLVDNSGRSAVVHAARSGCLCDGYRIIRRGCKQKRGTGDDRWLARWAVAVDTRNWQLVRYVIEKDGFDPTARAARGQTLFMLAARQRAGEQAARYFRAAGRTHCVPHRVLPLTDDDGNTALYWAVFAGDVYLCKTFLRAGADADTPAGDGRSLLSVAAAGADTEILRLLLRKVNNVNTQDGEGQTALSYAACNTDKVVMSEMVRLLMAAGAKPSRRLRDYQERLRPVGWAKKHGQEDEFRDAVLTWRIRN